MADAGLGVVTEALLNTVLSLAAEEIGLACGLKKELTKLAHKLEMVQALLSDAQSKQGNNQAVQLWLKRLQSVALDAQIVLDEFGYQVLRQKIVSRKRDKVRSFFSSSNPVVFRFKLAHKVKDVMSSLQQAESDQIGLKAVELKNLLPDPKENRSTSPFVEDSEIVSRDDDTPKVIDMLIGSDYHEDLPVMTILGMGGLGKTTLAQLVYKNDKVTRHFDKRVWVCVSDDFNVQRLLAEMLQSLTNSNSQLTNTEALVSELKKELGGKRYLLVLDDVWNKNKNEWDCMRGCLLEIGGSKGSKILATTREEDVAAAMRTSGYHRLQVLSKKQSWELFEKTAFAAGGATKTQQLVDIGERILERCGGVPLAIKAIGGLLYSKHFQSEWEMIETSRVWSDFSGEGKRVLSIIKLSYDQLPSLSLKQCFAYCAIFGKDTWMEKDMLIQLWMAQGLLNPPKGSDLQMEDVGSEYYNILLMSSLLQDAERDYLKNNGIRLCKMHDLVHDVSLQVSENYCFHVKDWRQVRNEIETVHLSITAGEREMWKRLKGIVPSKLRTLHLKGRNVLKEDLSANFRCLSVLIVEDEFEMELPNWIGKMKHLRFLDISRTQIGRLPNSFMELYYLQTLRINSLVELPRGFSQKLLNLRHLIVKTAIQHWLEAIDPRHRYGHNLHFYYVRWLHSQSKEPFFYWLDTGEGKEVNLVEKCPRWKLQQQCIKYLGPIERKGYEVAVEDGKLLYQQTREFLDTTAEPKAKWIFVLSTTRTMYVGKEKKGTFQHSSFLAGGATIAAGRLVVEKGILKALWPDSGRYRPTQENFLYFISFLKENNVDLNGVELDSVGHTTHEV